MSNINVNKKLCDIEADIIRSTEDTYTTLVKVFDKETKDPVSNGKIIISSKIGDKGSGELSDKGEARIVSDITRKDYKLSILFRDNEEYEDNSVSINFQKQYLFFKSMTYIWLSILGVILLSLSMVVANSILHAYFPNELVTTNMALIFPYVYTLNGSTLLHASPIFTTFLTVITWIIIVTLVIGGVYASQHNSNYQVIINKNVRNHFIMKNYVKVLGLIIIILAVLLYFLLFLF